MSDHRSRIITNAGFLAVHAVNVVCCLYAIREGQHALRDRRVADMKQQLFIFMTIWNIIYHLVYLMTNIICETQELYQIKDRGLLDPVKKMKQLLFDSILVPSTMSICIVFWPLFLYNRELLYPLYVDDALGPTANYLMHAFILPVAVWEMRYMAPREKHRGTCLVLLGTMCAAYMGVLLYNHSTTGLFPYPILYSAHGTVYFPMILAGCVLLIYITYHAQWPLRRLISVHQDRQKKSIKSK